MPRQNLGELEQLLLLAVMRLGDDAYGAAIRQEILDRTGRSITPGAIYPTLDRLERRGLLRSWAGDPRAERGGRARRHFAATPTGVRHVRESLRLTAALAAGINALQPKRGTRRD